MKRQPKIELLQAEVDCGDDQSFFRLLIDDRSIKYLTIDPGIYSSEDMCFGPSLASLLPVLPPGDWNDGLVSKNIDGEPYLASFKMTQFPGVQSTWHNTYIDYSELSIGEKLRTGIYEVECTRFPNRTIVAKFARFSWETQYLENETEAHAGAQDLDTCKEVLSRLHDLGARHGDTNRFNFLIHDSKATLIDFDTAQKCGDPDLLLKELENLAKYLSDPSNKGGGGHL
ncbi:alpha-galactosidase A precursor [Penicillium malachiteum]|uniref:Alpha-galactosidase A n=1 Tax=Penicillium malachiteum TaxID=1324776 RepID=A0AAD6MZF7_9EURO|nr:alpha-galactosidase A precursor [Penicillium malachiteum]